MGGRSFTFRSPAEADVTFLVEHMRGDDRRELKRWTGQDPEYEVRHSISCSQVCFAGVFGDGALACIFGACRANVLEEEAVVWMLSTTAVDRHPVEFYIGSKAGLDRLMGEMPEVGVFSNWVDLEYTRACRWLERLGFGMSLSTPKRPGFRGGEFGQFYIMNPHFTNGED